MIENTLPSNIDYQELSQAFLMITQLNIEIENSWKIVINLKN